MGIVQKQKNEIDGLKMKVERVTSSANEKLMRARKAEAKLAAGEKMIAILVKRLGGKVTISDQEWNEGMKILAKYEAVSKETEFILLEE